MLIAQVSSNRDNNLNLLRMLAAVGVLVSHAYPLSQGPDAVQPLSRALGTSLGGLCVAIFFIISGFLITQSAMRSRSLWHWVSARTLRLMPALIVVVTLTALVMGPIVTTLSLRDYFSNSAVAYYIVRNSTLVQLQYTLPGVFETNAYGPAINGSLWTLFYEVVCYFGVFILAIGGALRSKTAFRCALLIYFLGYVAFRFTGWDQLHYRLGTVLDLSFPFALGMVLYAFKDSFSLHWRYGFVFAAVAIAAYVTPVFKEFFTIALAYWVFLVGFLPAGGIRAYNGLGDYSYGVYVYAFPIQQLAFWLIGPMTPVMNMTLALPATLLFAFGSWHLVESPALSRRTAFGNALQWLGGGQSKNRGTSE